MTDTRRKPLDRFLLVALALMVGGWFCYEATRPPAPGPSCVPCADR